MIGDKALNFFKWNRVTCIYIVGGDYQGYIDVPHVR
jgi:hypothetical protein